MFQLLIVEDSSELLLLSRPEGLICFMNSSEGTKAKESEQILSHIKDRDLPTDDPDLIEAVLPCFGFNAETRLPQEFSRMPLTGLNQEAYLSLTWPSQKVVNRAVNTRLEEYCQLSRLISEAHLSQGDETNGTT